MTSLCGGGVLKESTRNYQSRADSKSMVWHTHTQTHAQTQMCVCVCEGAVPITSGCTAILFAGCCIPTCGGDTPRHIAIFWKPQSCNPSRKLKNSHMCPWHPSMKSSYFLWLPPSKPVSFPPAPRHVLFMKLPIGWQQFAAGISFWNTWDAVGGPGG